MEVLFLPPPLSLHHMKFLVNKKRLSTRQLSRGQFQPMAIPTLDNFHQERSIWDCFPAEKLFSWKFRSEKFNSIKARTAFIFMYIYLRNSRPWWRLPCSPGDRRL